MIKLDRQWAFDTALAGLRKQGCKSVDANEICMYRGLNGTRCGVGFLIPDERYNEDLENYDSSIRSAANAVVPGLADNREDCNFLADLQSHLHDDLAPDLSGLEPTAAWFAARFGLTYQVPA